VGGAWSRGKEGGEKEESNDLSPRVEMRKHTKTDAFIPLLLSLCRLGRGASTSEFEPLTSTYDPFP